MPEDFEPKLIVPSSEFNMRDNPNSILGVQANESFMLQSGNGHVLGSAGETVGFAKYQFVYDEQALGMLAVEDQQLSEELNDLSMTEEVKNYNTLNYQVSTDLPSKLIQAEQEMKQCEHLPKEDQSWINADANLRNAKGQLQDRQRDLDLSKQHPRVKSYLEAQAKRSVVLAKAGIPESIADSTSDLFAEKRDKVGKVISMEPTEGGDRALLARAVASKLVDNLIGTQSLAQEKFGKDNDGRTIGISVQVDGAGVIGMYQGSDYYLDVDYSDPDIQKGLSDLEVNDYITGQLDRHCGNIFVDPLTKKVTGIDNDLAFPEDEREKTLGKKTAQGKAISGLPSTLHRDTADRLAKLSPQDLRKELQNMETPEGVGKLSEASINGAVDRLKNLQVAIRKGTIKVVDQFDRQTYQAAIDKQDEAVRNGIKSGRSLSQCTLDDEWDLKLRNPTSYQGAIALQLKRYEIAEKTPRNANTVGQIARDSAFIEYAKLVKEKQNELRPGIASGRKQETDDLGSRRESYDKRLGLLYSNRVTGEVLWAKVKSLRYGGVAKAKQAFEAKLAGVMSKTREIDQSIEKEVEKRLEPTKNDLMKQAKEKVQSQQPKQQENLNQGIQKNQDNALKEEPVEKQTEPNKIQSGNAKEREMSLEETELLRAIQELPTEQQEQMRQRSNSLDISNEEIDRLLKEMEIDSLPKVDGNTPSLVSPESQNERGVISAKMPTENGIKTMPREEFLEKLKKQQNDEEYHDQNLGEGNMELNEIDEESRLLIEELNKKNGNVQKQQPHTLDHSHSVESMTGLVKHGETHESEGLNVGKKKVGQIIHRSDSSPHLGGHKL